MIYHLGRLIDHVHIRTADLEASRRFYRSVLMALGRSGFREAPEYFSADELWIDRGDGQDSRIHLAFQAADRESVDRFYAAALAAGGRDNGASANTIRAITPPMCSIRTGTTLKLSGTDLPPAPPPLSRCGPWEVTPLPGRTLLWERDA